MVRGQDSRRPFFRRGRRTDDNLFMLERMIEMAKVRKECACGFYRYGIWKKLMIE